MKSKLKSLCIVSGVASFFDKVLKNLAKNIGAKLFAIDPITIRNIAKNK
jgi:hypothetical protein